MSNYYGTLSADLFIGNPGASNDYYFEQWELTAADSILGGIFTDRVHFTGSHVLNPAINPLDGLFSVEYLYFDDLVDEITIPDSLAASSSDFSGWRLAMHMGGGTDFVDASGVTSDVPLLILAEDGNDTIIGGGDGSYYDGGEDDDRLYLSSGTEEARGGGGDDLFYADAYEISGDIIDGGAGYDELTMGTAGNFSVTMTNIEKMWLDDSADNGVTVYSPDREDGDALEVHVYGGVTDDIVTVESTDDPSTSGTWEHFLMLGLEGNDILTGGNGDDYLNGGAGVDGLDGGDGDDTLIGDGEGDLMAGGLGNDTYYGVASGDFVIEGPGGGIDTVQTLETVYTLPVFVESLDYDGAAALTAVGNAENNGMGGGVNGDHISGRGGVDWLVGYEGDDDLYGEEGDDLLMGGSEDDTLDGGTGADIMYGDEGSDTYVVDNAADAVHEDAGEGDADLVLSSVTHALGTHVENLWFTGAANVNGKGTSSGNVIVGNSGRNTLTGLGGDDFLYGLDGNDVLKPGEGTDTLDGGDDFDTANYAASTAAVAFGQYGDELLGDLAALFDRLVRVEAVTGSAFADIMTAESTGYTFSGLGGNDYFTSGTGADIYDGGTDIDTVSYANAAIARVKLALDGSFAAEGDAALDTISFVERITGTDFGDVLRGDGNANRLLGGGGADTLQGMANNDTILAGTGADALTGGGGDDGFEYTSTSHLGDTIHDFSSNVAGDNDSFRFTGAVFGGLPAGTLAANRFSANTTGLAATADHRFIYETDSGILRYDADGSGVGSAIIMATLTGAPLVVAGDFLIL